ncbi:thioredoxin family protein [Aureimonas leprariae]|uniref:Thioredoxin family protein n=1 Tax=Plantimonas leprariae TaxID=2615207 RepID=A0A7V7TZ17_9HYPH|nr:thioredoxin family protein [Aureimonas leprariae]KAB0678533.1 thioredoxin family protein [Aureimonas leprariae]
MPKTQSNPIALGTPAADFTLPDGNGRTHALASLAGPDALLVAFLSNRCPFVVLIREAFAAFAAEYEARGLQVVGINSNDAEAHPEEHAARLAEEAERFGYVFPYLKDERQEAAKAYGAACTPDFFLFDRDRRLAYHGQFDEARPGNGKPVTGADLRAAVDAVLSGGVPSVRQTPSIGCNIKWTPGNEPAAFSTAA